METGLNMDVPTLQRPVKKVTRAMLEERDTLVHCKQGKHRSGSFLVFVFGLLEVDKSADFLINRYLVKDPLLQPYDRGCVFRVWKEGGLRPLLASARQDPEVRRMVAEIHARMDGVKESRSQGVEASGRGTKRPSEAQQSPQERKRPSPQERKRPQLIPAAKVEGSPGSAGSSQRQDVEVSAAPQPTMDHYKHKPGDWKCPECGNWNFADRRTCNFNACPLAYWKRGDWTCGACGNHNYASRTHCAMRRCQAPRP